MVELGRIFRLIWIDLLITVTTDPDQLRRLAKEAHDLT